MLAHAVTLLTTRKTVDTNTSTGRPPSAGVLCLGPRVERSYVHSDEMTDDHTSTQHHSQKNLLMIPNN